MATDRLTSTIEWFEPDQVPGYPGNLILAIEDEVTGEGVITGFFDALSGEFMGGDMLGGARVNAIRWAYMPEFPNS